MKADNKKKMNGKSRRKAGAKNQVKTAKRYVAHRLWGNVKLRKKQPQGMLRLGDSKARNPYTEMEGTDITPSDGQKSQWELRPSKENGAGGGKR